MKLLITRAAAGAMTVGLILGTTASPARASSAPSGFGWAFSYQIHNINSVIAGITAPAKNDAYAVGYYVRGTNPARYAAPFLLHWNGNRWRKTPLPIGIYQPQEIASSSPGNVWIFGTSRNGSNTAIRWSGHRWRRVAIPGDAMPWPLGAVVLGPDNVWLAGLYNSDHWDGRSWADNLVTLYDTFRVTGISGTSSGNMWLSGLSGSSTATERAAAYRWVGGRWRPASMPHPRAEAACVVAQSATSVWIGAGTLQIQPYRWDGRRWQHVRPPRYGTNGCLLAPWGKDGVWADSDDLWTGHKWLTVVYGAEDDYPLGSVDVVLAHIPGTDLTWMSGVDDSGAAIMRTVRK